MAKKRGGKSGPAHSRINAPQQEKAVDPSWGGPILASLRFLGSLKLALVLMAVSIVVLARATFLESERDLDYALWFIYHSWWFITLVSLLAGNVVVAMLLKLPWKRRHIGFLVAHAGLLVLMAGSFQTFVAGIDGHVQVVEGGPPAESLILRDRSQLTTSWREGDATVAVDFSFAPGPADWPGGRTKDLGESDEIRVKVLGLYRHAYGTAGWGEDPSGVSSPVIHFALVGADGRQVTEKWLVGRKTIGTTMTVGPTNVTLSEVPVRSMLADLLDPPTDKLGAKGLLSIHYKGQVKQIPVDENVGKTVSIGDDGTKVEIVRYLAQPTSEPDGTFNSAGDEPHNPMLDLWVHLPNVKEPLRQLSLAKTPLMDFSGSRGIECPVKFFYHHPAVAVRQAVEFLQAPDGKLFCRVGTGKRYESRGEVGEGDTIKTSSGYQVHLLRHVRHARRETKFTPVKKKPGQSAAPEAAAHFEVSVAGETQEIWLQRNNRQFGAYTMQTPKGPMRIDFDYAQCPLGFSLKLIDFERGMNPGGMGDATYSSVVEIEDKSGLTQQHKIAMNEPAEYGKFTLYQSGFDNAGDGREVSRLRVAYDPGRLLKYAGCVMICLGTFMVFYLRGLF
ncbi:MAG: cytochrome c biogenesis protein ResB [Planctomycetes bacterium]|nr:cytochrome c biogenesis protein ResB [Planctomycetota bacterium]